MKIAVIIPTYNEAGAIGNLLSALQEVFHANTKHEWHVVVVDANSPDGTAAVVCVATREYKNIHLIVEPKKQGIGVAYCTGIAFALKDLGAAVVVEFDGDGQHDPKNIPRLIQRLEKGADYVIGSRYIPGGSVPAGWALYRKVLSRFGSLYTRLLLELPVHDVTSGFKATRAEFARKLPLSGDMLLSRSYAYKIHLLAETVRLGARTAEVPIRFLEREHDSSKSTGKDILESLWVTGVLRLRTLPQWRLLRVVTIGGVGFVLQTIVFEVLGIRLHLVRPSTAAVMGGELAILSNFFLNERFSFRDRVAQAAPFISRFVRFHVVSAGSVAVQWILIFAAESLTGEPVILRTTYVAGVLLGFLINYAGYYFWVWRKKE